MKNTKYQVDQRLSNNGEQSFYNEQGLKEMCVIVPKENEMCVQAPLKKEMCTIVHPNTDMVLENNQIPCCEPEKKVMCIKVNKKEKSLILNEYSDNDFAFSLNQKINKIDSLIGTLPKEKVYLAEAQSEISTYDLMSMFLEKFSVLTRKKKFYLYNGKYYEISDVTSIKQKMLGAFREVVRDKNISFIEGAVKYLLIEPNIVIEDNDIRDDLVAFDNKVLNINTGLTYAHSPDYIVTYAINASYIDEYCPLTPIFDGFLEQIMGGDMNLIARIWMMIGYVLTPDTKGKCIFLLQGVGNSGKSLLIKLLQQLLSNDAFFPFDIDSLGSTFGLGDLFGKAICVCQDMPNRHISSKSVGVLKELSGDDTVSSAVKYEGPIVFDNKAKLILVSNHAVRPQYNDDAFWNRLVTIPFYYAVRKEAQNKNLLNELLKERDAIVTKAVIAYCELRKNNYIFPGNYQPNEVVDFSGDLSESLSMSVFNFVKQYFEEGTAEEYVLTETAHELFLNNKMCCSRSEFSQHYKKCVFEIFPNACEVRKRKSGKGNPMHGIKGIKFKEILL